MDYLEPCHYSTRLIEKLTSLDSEKVLDFDLINKAIYWAKKYHDGQFRKSGEPFYTHPLEVAYMLSEYKLKTDVIVTAILHDVVEDSDATVGMIVDAFGWRIAEMVDRLTRDRPDGSKLSVETILNNAYEKNDKEVILIKLIDRLHNIQTVGSMSDEKRTKILLDTMLYFLIPTIQQGHHEIEQYIWEIYSQYNLISSKDIRYHTSNIKHASLYSLTPIDQNKR